MENRGLPKTWKLKAFTEHGNRGLPKTWEVKASYIMEGLPKTWEVKAFLYHENSGLPKTRVPGEGLPRTLKI